tara:strand:+ start:290 stop:463 length:174 start_codon:yes stop_codon:yes gene_type:complete
MIHLNINIYELKNEVTGQVVFTAYDHVNDENPFEDQFFNTHLEIFTAIEKLNVKNNG